MCDLKPFKPVALELWRNNAVNNVWLIKLFTEWLWHNRDKQN